MKATKIIILNHTIAFLSIQLFLSCSRQAEVTETSIARDFRVLGEIFQEQGLNYDSLWRVNVSPEIKFKEEGFFSLDLVGYGFNTLPKSIEHFDGLRTLVLSGNEISKLEADSMERLGSLFLGYNKIEEFPNLKNFSALTSISLDNNLLKGDLIFNEHLPERIFSLTLYNNEITSVTFDRKHEELSVLRLEDNQIREINKSFKLLPDLSILDISGNLIDTLDCSNLPSSDDKIIIRIYDSDEVVMINNPGNIEVHKQRKPQPVKEEWRLWE